MEEGVAGDLLSFKEELHRMQQIAFTVQRGCNKKTKKQSHSSLSDSKEFFPRHAV